MLFQQNKFRFILGSAILSIVFYLFLRFGVAKMYLAQGSIAPIYRATLVSRLINIPAIVFYYFKTFLFPFSLGVDQYWIVRNVSVLTFYLPLLVCLLISFLLFFAGVYLRKKQTKKLLSMYVFFLIWFLVGIVFHLQLIPLDATVADRWFYFSFVGILGMSGVFVSVIPWGKFSFSKYLVIFFWFTSFVLGLITFFRCFNWRDDMSLYSHDMSTTQNNFILDNAYATALIEDGQFSHAKPYVLESLTVYPYYANINNMAIIDVSEKKYIRANEYFLQAISQSRNYMVYENYSSFLLHYGRIVDARVFTKKALLLFPDSFVLRTNMQDIYKKLK